MSALDTAATALLALRAAFRRFDEDLVDAAMPRVIDALTELQQSGERYQLTLEMALVSMVNGRAAEGDIDDALDAIGECLLDDGHRSGPPSDTIPSPSSAPQPDPALPDPMAAALPVEEAWGLADLRVCGMAVTAGDTP